MEFLPTFNGSSKEAESCGRKGLLWKGEKLTWPHLAGRSCVGSSKAMSGGRAAWYYGLGEERG